MSYIGQNLPTDVFGGYATDTFAGDGSATTFTLSQAPFNEQGLIVVINNVIQQPTTNYTVSGTTLTIVGTAVASGDVIYARHTGVALPIGEANALDLQGQSDKLILDADGDSTISADTDDTIHIKTGGTDRVTVTDSNVAIAQASGTVLSLGNVTSSATSTPVEIDFGGTYSSTAGQNPMLNLWNNGASGAFMGIGVSGNQIDYTTSATTYDHVFYGNAQSSPTEIMRVHGDGDVTIADGNIVMASGHGINFAATADGTTMSSELLDDYEEGDCTLGFTTSSGAMTMHSTYKYGKYTKVGNLVTVTGYVIGNGIGSATSSQGLTMTGLPFSIIGENGAYSALSVGYAEGLNITAGQHIGGYARINYATVPLLLWDATTGTSIFLQSELSNDGGFIFSIMYYVS